MHPSFEPVDRNGTYYRRIKDIRRGLKELGMITPNENSVLQFLENFSGCEKLATAIVGIKKNSPVDEVFRPGFKLTLSNVIDAVKELKLTVPDDHLTWLFNDDPKLAPLDQRPPDPYRLSAKQLRDRAMHHFGPYIVSLITERWGFFAPKMSDFLACDEQVLRRLEEKWAARGATK